MYPSNPGPGYYDDKTAEIDKNGTYYLSKVPNSLASRFMSEERKFNNKIESKSICG
jgi:hypothetical protein